MAEETPKFKSATMETTEKMQGVLEISGNKTNNCRKIPNELPQLLFAEVGAKYHYKIKKTLAPFCGCVE